MMDIAFPGLAFRTPVIAFGCEVSGQRRRLSEYATYQELVDYTVSFCFSKHVRAVRKPVAELLDLLQRVWKSEIRKPNSVV